MLWEFVDLPAELLPEPPQERAEPQIEPVAAAGARSFPRATPRPVGSAIGIDPIGSTGTGPEASGTEAAVSENPSLSPDLLSPTAVARGTFGPRVETPEERGAAMEAALEGDLYQLANAAAYDTVRPPPTLEPTGDGGFRYSGHAFNVEIAPDGAVSFSDHANLRYQDFGGFESAGMTAAGVTFSFDITDAIERRMGNDPYAAERRWFLRETRRVRHELAERARVREQGRGLVRLRRQMRSIWGSERSYAEKRAQLFALWDECSSDEIGDEARSAIIEFINQRAAAGAQNAFSTGELRTLNARRRSREPFAPYNAPQ